LAAKLSQNWVPAPPQKVSHRGGWICPRPGKGTITGNDRPFANTTSTHERARALVAAAAARGEWQTSFDVFGPPPTGRAGPKGQAGAVRLGIARALL